MPNWANGRCQRLVCCGTAVVGIAAGTIGRVISRVHSFVLQGIDAVCCEIEADLTPTKMPRTAIVGLPDAAVKESMDRVRTAILNSGYRFPHGRVTINLAPAELRKEGPVYDLPIAVAVLAAGGTIDTSATGNGLRTESFLVAGELALDGRVRPIRGVVSLAQLARDVQMRGVIVAAASAAEAAVVEGIEVRGVTTLGQVVGMLNGACTVEPHPAVDIGSLIADTRPEVDFADIRGQEAVKRALTIAAAGAHNVLMIGPAGTGKTMMAKALPGVLPPLSADEALEVTRIYSSVGRLGRQDRLGAGNHRRREHPPARRCEPRPPGRALSRRDAGVPPQCFGDASPAAGGRVGDRGPQARVRAVPGEVHAGGRPQPDPPGRHGPG
jgi:magnesium chelatase family protein